MSIEKHSNGPLCQGAMDHFPIKTSLWASASIYPSNCLCVCVSDAQWEIIVMVWTQPCIKVTCWIDALDYNDLTLKGQICTFSPIFLSSFLETCFNFTEFIVVSGYFVLIFDIWLGSRM